jgi:hypothetical protein
MLKEFVNIIESDESVVDVANLFGKADKSKWEKWINIFETIRIDNVASGLKEVSETYKLNKTEEVTILAYVKFLELMIHKVESVGRMGAKLMEDADKKALSSFNEAMYG